MWDCSTNKFRQRNHNRIVHKDIFLASGFQPRSHQALEDIGLAVAVGGGYFICAQCGVVGRPFFHRDMGEIFVVGSACGCVWATWAAISQALDMEGAA